MLLNANNLFFFKGYVILFLLIFTISSIKAQTVTYTESTEDITNPDRGFYDYTETKASNYTPLSLSELISHRNNFYSPSTANYSVKTTLVFRYFVLDDFYTGTAISQTFLDNMEADFEIARQAGVRLIIRYTYNINPDNSCGESACLPYLDGTKATILNHIMQLKPYLQANADVIAAVQSGFIGVWGEQYYTTYFGDTSDDGDDRYSNTNWNDRNEVLAAVLDATPLNRMVQVRYPQLKQRFLGGPNAPVTYPAMTSTQAHNNSNISRIGFHNDCFLSSPDDYGTYFDYGNNSSFPSNQIDDLKPYAEADGQYVAVGGETCNDGDFDPQNNCAGQALTDMASLHYSYLNAEYQNDVNNDWEDDGCMDEIKRKLGYRFVLQNGTYPTTAAAGTTMNFTLNVENVGWAAPFNERTLQIVMRNATTNQEYELPANGTNIDTRFWHTGFITVDGNVSLPVDMVEGNYELFLQIFDSANNNMVADRPEYCIQLANTNMWEANTGYNDLNHIIEITEGMQSCQIGINGNFDDWSGVTTISTNGSGGLTELKVVDDENLIYLYVGTVTNTHYQFYLDTDNNASGSNEFTGSSWSANGMNYLIENGTLFHYVGSGPDFTWDPILSLDAQKTASGVELVLNKSLLTDLAATINIGYANLNSSYNEVGIIPDDNSAASYTLMNILDCGCSSVDLILAGGINATQTYETDGMIETTQTLTGDIEVVYDAAVSILLDKGFSVSNGVTLDVFIDGCNAPNFSATNSAELKESTNSSLSLISPSATLNVFPNPVENQLTVSYETSSTSDYSLTVFNAFGEVISKLLTQEPTVSGTHHLNMDVSSFPKGIYFVLLESAGLREVKKFVKE